MRNPILLLLVAASVTVLGCGGGSGGSSKGSSTGSTTKTSTTKGTQTTATVKGANGKPKKVSAPVAVLLKADGIKSPTAAQIKAYTNGLAAARKKCPKTSRAHLANLAKYVHNYSVKHHAKLSALDGLAKGASYQTSQSDCVKRFQAFAATQGKKKKK